MKPRMILLPVLMLIALSAPLSVWADNFTLGRYIPEDMHVMVNGRHTEARAQVMEAFCQAFERLQKSGIAEDVFDLATLEMPEKKKNNIRGIIKEVLRLLTMPDWEALCAKEVALGVKMMVPVPEYSVVFKVNKGEAEKHLADFARLFKEIQQRESQLRVEDGKQEGIKFVQLNFGVPFFSLNVAAHKDVVVLATNEGRLDAILPLLKKGNGEGSLIKTDKFKAAFKDLPAAEDTITYLDITQYIQFYRGILGMAQFHAGDNWEAQTVFMLVNGLLDELSAVSTVGMVEYTRDDKIMTDSRISFAPGEKKSLLEGLIADQKSMDYITRIVPKDAFCSFATSSVDNLKLYNAVLSAIGKTPKGEKALEIWERIQEKVGFNLRRDLYSWVEGGFGWTLFQNGQGGCEGVFFMRVKDDEKARSLIEPLLARAKKYCKRRGQKVSLVPLDDRGDFRELRIEAMPFCRPVIGFPRGMLIIASSAKVIQRFEKTIRQEAPSIAEHPAVAALEVPGDNVKEFLYRDLDGMLEGLSNVVGTAGFFVSIMPDFPKAKGPKYIRKKQAIRKVGAILTKLAAFIRDVDLGLAYTYWVRYDGEKRALFSRQVMQFRKRAKM